MIEPQAGAQSEFFATSADIAIYGGAAGGGKSWALLVEPIRHIHNPEFRAVIFRRNTVQVRNPGGLWDESMKIYFHANGHPRGGPLEWEFPSGARVKFAHLEYENTVYDWQGSQLPLLAFDELTHFTRSQFFYMMSRNRSTCGVRPYIRATCNPDADSWVAGFISWWIDQDTGLPIKERSGVLRWFVNLGDCLYWADDPAELIEQFGEDTFPKSVTFIAATLQDNRILMEADPGYLANLKALPLVERERLLGGNWLIRPSAGLYFRREWVQVVDAYPADLSLVRYWDLAATPLTNNNDPDFTVCALMGKSKDGYFYVIDGMSMRDTPFGVKTAIKNVASQDDERVLLGLPIDPGQAGVSQMNDLTRFLAGHNVRARRESGDKITRFQPFSAQCEAGNVFFVRGDWNEEFFRCLEAFPESAHDDHVDAISGAFNLLVEKRDPMRINPKVIRPPYRVPHGPVRKK